MHLLWRFSSHGASLLAQASLRLGFLDRLVTSIFQDGIRRVGVFLEADLDGLDNAQLDHGADNSIITPLLLMISTRFSLGSLPHHGHAHDFHHKYHG